MSAHLTNIPKFLAQVSTTLKSVDEYRQDAMGGVVEVHCGVCEQRVKIQEAKHFLQSLHPSVRNIPSSSLTVADMDKAGMFFCPGCEEEVNAQNNGYASQMKQKPDAIYSAMDTVDMTLVVARQDRDREAQRQEFVAARRNAARSFLEANGIKPVVGKTTQAQKPAAIQQPRPNGTAKEAKAPVTAVGAKE